MQNDASSEPWIGPLDIAVVLVVVALILWYRRWKKRVGSPDVVLDLRFKTKSSSAISDRSIVSKMKAGNKNMVILYGSQTGTAEEFAGRLAKDAQRYGLRAMAIDPEDYDLEELDRLKEIDNCIVVLCMATYGEGDPTDNAQDFHEWLKSTDADLQGLRFAVFGLGNKTYEHYNSMARFFDKRMEELGAERVFERGEGDDDANIEEDFVTWKEKLWPSLCEQFGLEQTGGDQSIRDFRLQLCNEGERDKVFTGEISRFKSYETQKPPFDAKNPFMAPIVVNRELHTGGSRSCMHIELDITGSKMRYNAGDHVAIFPTNSAEIVQRYADLLGFDPDQAFSLINVDEQANKKHPFPCPCSFRTALLHYVDITSTPHTHVLKELAEYAADSSERDFLNKLTSPTEEGKHQYNEWIVKDHRTLIDVLEDLPSFRPPIDHVLELLPRLQCRYYSISSSPKMYPTRIHVTAVLVDYQTRIGRHVDGVATAWLAPKKPNENRPPRVPIYVRKSNFRLPVRSISPIVMIGPGTGLAPFRGFIQDRKMTSESGKRIGDTVLYFGCRKEAEDFLYKEELEGFVADKTLSALHAAFSRDQPQKVYVTHLMENNKQELWNILDNGGHVYICGDARNMAKDVHSILVKVVEECGQMKHAQAEDYIKKLQTRGRYSADVWS
ncbi:NADPH--cytochrome P450 reductase-like [Oscarella lobularis]|uniref:NADPH--cytochrome P450 reductase-like n=1 Tax=Oscarella lobularis TaxID=121494 RepID=UPI0033133FBC